MYGLSTILLCFILSVFSLMASGASAATAAGASDPALLSDAFLSEKISEEENQVKTTTYANRAPLVDREHTRVSILGYHNFSETEPVAPMMLRTSEFRAQMEYIKKAGLTVISMQEFLDWRFGSRRLPAQCVLITLDDGWKSVYTEAFPIFKEYGYPFTLFLYTDFISGRGLSLSPAQIKEMQKNGASVGSHSKSHPYPSDWKKAIAEGPESIAAMCDEQIKGSHKRLETLFDNIQGYCYPGGYVTPEMLELLPKCGYLAAFTVLPAKVDYTEDPWQIHRYMILGDDSSIFDMAMDFRTRMSKFGTSIGAEPGTLPPSTPLPPFPTIPSSNTVVNNDLQSIQADLSPLTGVDFSSIRMYVSGFGQVPAKIDSIARNIVWTLPMKVYMSHLSVHITWKTTDGISHKAEWSFRIDQAVSVD